MGSNSHGQLGLKDKGSGSTLKPTLIKQFIDQQVIDIACGNHHSLCLVQERVLDNSSSLTNLNGKSQGLVYSWGSNSFGQLGIGVEHPMTSEPQRVMF
jgi:alpha-tubulin suppressor-like RCC1 family protein